MERIWILLTGILMLFSQAKAGERPFVVNLPVEPTPTVTMDKRQVPLLEILQELEKQTGVFFSYESSLLDEFPKILSEKVIFRFAGNIPADRADRDPETEAAVVHDQWFCP